MGFEQAAIRVVKDREFQELRAAVDAVLAGDQIVEFLRALNGKKIQVRNLDAILAANIIDRVGGAKTGSARLLYQSLTVSDQAQLREFYLSKIEEVEPALRAKFHKIYQYS